MSETIRTLKIQMYGVDKEGFNIDKDLNEYIFQDVGMITNTDIQNYKKMVRKGINALSKKRMITITYYDEAGNVISSIRWTYEAYDGHEWMRRELAGNQFLETENFVKTNDIIKHWEKLHKEMQQIKIEYNLKNGIASSILPTD